jgi:hypothetical protein
MKSKLLQKKSYSVNQSRKVVDGHRKTSKIRPCHGRGLRPHLTESTRRLRRGVAPTFSCLESSRPNVESLALPLQ